MDEFSGSAIAHSGDSGRERELAVFLDDAFDDEIRLSPQTAASLGMPHQRDQLDDYTDAARLRHLELLESQLEELRSRFPYADLGADARLNVELFEDRVERTRASYRWRHHIAPMSIDGGPQDSAHFLISQHDVKSVEDALDYIHRLQSIERVLSELADRLDAQRKLGILPTERQLVRMRGSLRPYGHDRQLAQRGDNVVLADFVSKVSALEGLSDVDRDELIRAASTALEGEVRRGCDRYKRAIESVAGHTRANPGVWSLPDGDAYYIAALRRWSTTDMQPHEIHEIGLAEVQRIKREMAAVLDEVGYGGSLTSFADAIRTDERFRYSEDDLGRTQLLNDASRNLTAALESAPRFFSLRPAAPIEVRAVEKWREANLPIAVYDAASPDGTRPGILYINLADMTQAQKVQLATIVHHEGVPGHHFQLALAQERGDICKFRRFGYDYGAYIEGWALYAERLADEMGLYQDPYSRFGMLSMQMRRACRLVVDTGLHAKRWTRERAIGFLADNSSMSALDSENETDRYIGSPGQATAYMIGQHRILALRKEAETVLRSGFDIRDFHDAVLRNGALPLDVLERLMRSWIAKSVPNQSRA